MSTRVKMTNPVVNGIDDSKKDKTKVKSDPGLLKSYIAALRPWSFTASFTPVALGSTLAYKSDQNFSFLVFVIAVLTALSVHAAGNLVNTYFDYIRGIDNKSSDDRTLVDHVLEPSVVSRMGAVFYSLGCLGFLTLAVASEAKMEHLAVMYFGGLSSSFLYTGGLGLKYIALGDLLIFFTFGPLTVMFAFLSQTGKLTMIPVLYALPLALNTEAILHSNNTRDMDSDQRAGIVTMAILLGRTGSYTFFTMLIFLPFFIFALMGMHYSLWMLLPMLCIFEAFNVERDFRNDTLKGLPQRVAKMNLILGILYTVGCMLADKSAFSF
ncbi:hypothetical protein FSP39_023700 [Pinctada imbricata]|uniref:UbiA prenyltransferase domain-containing protein 1 n=1 Tax=Pinctada imbricata TaxID=66713 RepID=A0AA88YU02_PINIB|nr:hypothetical protein FSP39_023700 [Pinctada imbricata]